MVITIHEKPNHPKRHTTPSDLNGSTADIQRVEKAFNFNHFYCISQCCESYFILITLNMTQKDPTKTGNLSMGSNSSNFFIYRIVSEQDTCDTCESWNANFLFVFQPLVNFLLQYDDILLVRRTISHRSFVVWRTILRGVSMEPFFRN